MKTTAAILRELQDYYDSLPSRPTVKEIAHLAQLPVATTARFLNGTNKAGAPDRVRALCLALDRHDLADKLPQNPSFNTVNDVMVLYRESEKESRESNLEELERVRDLHAKAEQRWERIIESKDKSIEILSKRIEKLEIDKENQSTVNKGLLADKVALQSEMEYFRKSKRKYEAALIIVLTLIIVYICVFDLPNPSNGITHLLGKFFG